MVRRGGDLGLGGLKEFLVALIDQAGNFTANHNARFGKDTDSSIVSLLNGGRAVQLFQEHTVLCSRSFQNVKSMLTKPIYGFFISALLCSRAPLLFLCHKSPDALQIPDSNMLLPRKMGRMINVAHLSHLQQHYPCAEIHPRPADARIVESLNTSPLCNGVHEVCSR